MEGLSASSSLDVTAELDGARQLPREESGLRGQCFQLCREIFRWMDAEWMQKEVEEWVDDFPSQTLSESVLPWGAGGGGVLDTHVTN